MEKRKPDESIEYLIRGILTLQTPEECLHFFEDLCTVTELQALSQRMEVAALLRRGETYAAIAEKTGASTATISRVNRCLSYGSDGYQTVLRRLAEGKPE